MDLFSRTVSRFVTGSQEVAASLWPQTNVEVQCGKTTAPANEGPLPFETLLAKGAFEIATKTEPLDPRTEQYFIGGIKERRKVAFRLDMQFLRAPKDVTWMIGGEIDGELTVDLPSRLICNLFLSVFKVYERRMQSSFGGNGEAAFISMPLERLWPNMSNPKEGETYHLETGSVPVDLESWAIVDVPKGSRHPLSKFWGPRPFRMFIAAQYPDGSQERALEFELHYSLHNAASSTDETETATSSTTETDIWFHN
jgi:hypothetical protein